VHNKVATQSCAAHRISGSFAENDLQLGARGLKVRLQSVSEAAARPTKISSVFVPRDTKESEFLDVVDFGGAAFSV